MSEKLLELSSVVNVISRTVGDMETQRQHNETRSIVLNALVLSVVNAMTPEQRVQVLRNFTAASQALLAASTRTGRTALAKEIADVEKLLGV